MNVSSAARRAWWWAIGGREGRVWPGAILSMLAAAALFVPPVLYQLHNF